MQPPDQQQTENWLTSKEAKKVLKVSSCELMHLRVAGKLPYKKQGNAYFYQIPLNSKQTS
jgi:hypothetical protein